MRAPSALPSGSVVQAQVTERFTLTFGETASTDLRTEDVLLYRAPVVATGNWTAAPAAAGAVVGAAFPITASRAFQGTELSVGTVHLDILAGCETVRGATGGVQPVTVSAGDVRLEVAAGSLAEDAPMRIQPVLIDVAWPTGDGTLTILGAYAVDLSGRVLASPAAFSLPASALPPFSSLFHIAPRHAAWGRLLAVTCFVT